MLQICVEPGHLYGKHARLHEAEQRFKQTNEGYVKNIRRQSSEEEFSHSFRERCRPH